MQRVLIVRDIPDPYFANVEGFEHVLDLCETAAHRLAAHYQTNRHPAGTDPL